jgi:hypothetical protein
MLLAWLKCWKRWAVSIGYKEAKFPFKSLYSKLVCVFRIPSFVKKSIRKKCIRCQTPDTLFLRLFHVALCPIRDSLEVHIFWRRFCEGVCILKALKRLTGHKLGLKGFQSTAREPKAQGVGNP